MDFIACGIGIDGLAFSQVALRLSRHLAHDLGAVDEEEESSRLVGHGPGDQGLPRPGGPVEEDPTGWLHADGAE